MNALFATHESGAEIWKGWAAIDWDWLLVSIKLSYWGPGLSDDDIKTRWIARCPIRCMSMMRKWALPGW